MTLVQSVKKVDNNVNNDDCEDLNERFWSQPRDCAIAEGLEVAQAGEQPSSTIDHKMTTPISPELSSLKDIFTGLVSVYRMMRSRNLQTTFRSMKEWVERASKRRFEEKDLYQMEKLVPDLLHLENIGENILIKLSNCNMGNNGMVRFQQALVDFVSDQQGNRTHEFHSRGQSNNTIGEDEKVQFQSPKKKKQRRLSILCCASQTKGPDVSCPGSKDNGDILLSLPKELRRRSLDGIISLDSLHKLDKNEMEYRRLSGSEAQLERQQRATISSLPDTFQRVRAIFGKRGPKVLCLDALCNRMRSGGLETVSKSDITARIRCLAEHAPEYIVLEESCGKQEVWVTRDKVDYSSIMIRLKALPKKL